MVDFEEAKRRLAEINSAISDYDDALKPRACDVLIPILFPEMQKAPAKTPKTDSPQLEITASSFDQLFELWSPETGKDRALLAAYFVQVMQQEEAVTGQAVNTILKNHGVGIGNITDAINANIQAQPALMMQLRKSGSTKQARKQYKVTTAGIKYVESKLSEQAPEGND